MKGHETVWVRGANRAKPSDPHRQLLPPIVPDSSEIISAIGPLDITVKAELNGKNETGDFSEHTIHMEIAGFAISAVISIQPIENSAQKSGTI